MDSAPFCVYIVVMKNLAHLIGQIGGLALLALVSSMAYPLFNTTFQYNIALPDCKRPDFACMMSSENIVVFADQNGRITLASDDSTLYRRLGWKQNSREFIDDYAQLASCLGRAKQSNECIYILLYADGRMSYKVLNVLIKRIMAAGYCKFHFVVSYRPPVNRCHLLGWQ